jgi:hypothetical protein
MDIIIVGHRCKICDAVEELVCNVWAENEISATIRRVVRDIDAIKLGVFLTPAVVVESEIKVMGRKPRKEEVLSWIVEERQIPDESDDTECSSKLSNCVNYR